MIANCHRAMSSGSTGSPGDVTNRTVNKVGTTAAGESRSRVPSAGDEGPEAPGRSALGEKDLVERTARRGVELAAGDLLPADAQQDLRRHQRAEHLVAQRHAGLGDLDHL